MNLNSVVHNGTCCSSFDLCCTCTLLAKKLCDSIFLGKKLDLIHPHFNMYGFGSYLFLYIIN